MFDGSKSRIKGPSDRHIEQKALLLEYTFHLKRKEGTVHKLFEECRCEHPNGYHHTNFGVLLRRYMLQSKVVGCVEHYVGDKLEVTDEFTGEIW